MMTVKDIREWLDRIPDDVGIGVDSGGLTLLAEDDPTQSHEPRCTRRFSPAAECSCWKTASLELGGLPDGDDR